MTMETTDYVSYPLALALKKAGFDWKCRAHYTNDYVNDDSEDVSREVKFHYDWTSPYDYNRIVGNTSAPTLAVAQKWLREKWRFDIEIRVWLVDVEREYRPYIMPPKCKDFIAYPPEKSYEQALSAGIEAVLELIEKKGE